MLKTFTTPSGKKLTLKRHSESLWTTVDGRFRILSPEKKGGNYSITDTTKRELGMEWADRRVGSSNTLSGVAGTIRRYLSEERRANTTSSDLSPEAVAPFAVEP